MHKKQTISTEGRLPVYRDQRLTNLPGEKWDDIPGLDGYFLVSSVGRIKRQERELVYPNGSVRTLKAKVILPRRSRTFNKLRQDYMYGLHAHLSLGGRRYHFAIRRLVYHCFVQPLALDDLSVCIVTKRGNGLDIRANNLKLIDTRSRTRRIYEKGRMESIFRQDRFRQKGVLASLPVTRREVSQYDAAGRRIRTFVSISDAARATGISHSRISHVVNELEPTANGFYWRFGKDKRFDVAAFLSRRRQAYREKRGTKVSQYDLQGRLVARYNSLQDAASAVDGHWTAISAVIRGKNKTAYSFRWKKGHSNKNCPH